MERVRGHHHQAVRPDPALHAVPSAVLERIEHRYWAPIEIGAWPESFMFDAALYESPATNPALFSDHGVVHVRDIAAVAVGRQRRQHLAPSAIDRPGPE